MAIDASIYNALGGAPKSMAQYADEYAAADDRKLARQMNALQMQEAQAGMMDKARTRQEQEALRAFMGQGGDLSKPEVQRDLYKVAPTQAGAIIKGQSEASKAAVEAQAKQFDLQKTRLDYAWQAVGSASNPQAAQAAILDGLRQGFFDQAQAEREVQAIPQDQAGFAQWRNGKMMAILSAKDQINAQQEAEKMQEAARHNKRGEEITVRGQDVTATTTRRGQDMVASTAAAGRAQSDRHFNTTQAAASQAVTYQQDANGNLIALPTKIAPGGAVRATPVMAPGGVQPMAGKGGQSVNARVTDAKDALALIDQAKKLLPGATASLAGAGIDAVAGAVGYSTDGAQAAAQLKAIEGALIAKMPKMSGPQSDKDVAMYKQAAGVVGDETKPYKTRMAALETVAEIQRRNAGGDMPAAAPAAKPAGRPPLSSFNR